MPEQAATDRLSPVAAVPSPGFSLLVYPEDGPNRPWLSLLLYLAILFTPLLILMAVAHFTPHTRAATHPASTAPPILTLAEASTEWGTLAYVLFATWLMARVEGRRLPDYSLHGPGIVKRFATGALLGVCFFSLLIAILFGTHHMAFGGLLLRGGPAWLYGFLWLLMFLAVGLFEELFFRGYLQVVLARCFASLYRAVYRNGTQPDAWGFWAAAVIISFGFGFVHHSNAGESPIGLVAAGLVGLTFSYSLWRTGTLWWAIGFHTAWDWAESFLYGTGDSGALIQGRLVRTDPLGPSWLSGGFTGPEGSLFVLAILVIVAILIRATLAPTRALAEQPVLQQAHNSQR